MKLTSITEVQRLRYAIEREFGYVPENVVVESEEVVEEGLADMRLTNQKLHLDSNITVAGVRVVRGICEIVV